MKELFDKRTGYRHENYLIYTPDNGESAVVWREYREPEKSPYYSRSVHARHSGNGRAVYVVIDADGRTYGFKAGGEQFVKMTPQEWAALPKLVGGTISTRRATDAHGERTEGTT